MSRKDLDRLFATVRAEGRTAFLPFMTAGLPTPEQTVDTFVAMAEAGADAFEVGIPYSDPLMDGPTIQLASAKAIEHGMNLRGGFETLGRVVEATGRPSLAMSYANPVFRLGPDEFAGRAADAGASGLIVADLPLEEASPVMEATERAGIGLVLFAAPTTQDERLTLIAAEAPVFIYGVAEMGVTGEREETSHHPRTLATRIRAITDTPLVMGVGIGTPEQAAALAPYVDGVIVGSALVRRALYSDDPVSEIAVAARHLAEAISPGLRTGS
ncbi:MAG: tryptophan synthase subunit alpha [bacterium]|nr:tryptophan synthase subunit alpha [bacterium]